VRPNRSPPSGDQDVAPPGNDGTAPEQATGEQPDPAPGEAEKIQGFEVVNVEEVRAIWEDENFQWDIYVIVDARADDPYKEGHIPGAIQCDYYRIEHYWPEVLTRAAAAEKIVVYCNGGDCEDSLYVCGELVASDIPKANVLLFKGGWTEWTAAGLPIATGRE
jgi:3-mercaptopyruvate sulfurtransferase SseA